MKDYPYPMQARNEALCPFTRDTQLSGFLTLPKSLLCWGLSPGALLVYGLLLDRGKLSQRSGWTDKQGWVYVIFPVRELALALGKGVTTIKRWLRELEERELIFRTVPFQGEAGWIFLRVPRCGVDYQALRFVHHDDVLVLVHHVQRDILRHDVRRLRLRQFHRHRFPVGQPGVFSEGFSRRRHPALLHQFLNGGAGQLRLLCQPCVQPLPGILTGRLQDQRLHPFSSCHAFRRSIHSRSRPEWPRTRCTHPPR